MLRIKLFLLYAGVVVGLTACGNEPASEGGIEVDLSLRMPDITYTQVIPLETHESALLDGFYHLYSTSSHYIAQDFTKIIVYDKAGKIEQVIAPLGRGPNEVLSLGNIWPDERSIKILDMDTGRIAEYGYDGKFIKAVKTDFRPMDFCAFNGGFLLDCQTGLLDNGNVLAISSAAGDTIKTGIEILAEGLIYGTEKFQPRENNMLYLPSHSNTVYKVDGSNNIESYYTFDFGNHWPKKKTINEHKNPVNTTEFLEYLKDNDMIGFLKFKETDNFITLNFERVDDIYNWFYNKTTGEQYLVKANDDPVSIAGSRIVGVDGGSFIFEIPAFSYRDYPGLPPLEIEDADNPVLIVAHLN